MEYSNCSRIAKMVNGEINDDVVLFVYQLLKDMCIFCSDYIGFRTPALIELNTNGNLENRDNCFVPLDTFSINIHHLSEHWVTSCVFQGKNIIYVHDSMATKEHQKEIVDQLKYIYGSELPPIEFVNVKQQGTDPICGHMAIAFAVDCCLGENPGKRNYDLSEMIPHLESCILQNSLGRFPIVESADHEEHIFSINHDDLIECDDPNLDEIVQHGQTAIITECELYAQFSQLHINEKVNDASSEKYVDDLSSINSENVSCFQETTEPIEESIEDESITELCAKFSQLHISFQETTEPEEMDSDNSLCSPSHDNDTCTEKVNFHGWPTYHKYTQDNPETIPTTFNCLSFDCIKIDCTCENIYNILTRTSTFGKDLRSNKIREKRPVSKIKKYEELERVETISRFSGMSSIPHLNENCKIFLKKEFLKTLDRDCLVHNNIVISALLLECNKQNKLGRYPCAAVVPNCSELGTYDLKLYLQNVPITAFRIILIPQLVNIRKEPELNHFYIIAIFPGSQTVAIVDSSELADMERKCNKIISDWRDLMEDWRLMFNDTPKEWTLVRKNSVQQIDCYSCGIFAILNGQLLLWNKPLNWIHPEVIDLYRQCIKLQFV